MNAYTVPLEDGMRVKHDAKARFTVRASRAVLEDHLVDVRYLGGAITLAGITYNRLSYSGGVSWWNPSTGRPIAKPKVQVRFRPVDVLTGEQECDCSSCIATAA
jgi:hypothetical protein